MAIYRCEAKSISRGQGRSCVAAAAYRHAEKLQDERQQLTHSYERKQGVTHSEIIAPENAPDWTQDRGKLWNHIDAAEKRKDAMTAREVLVALPRELNHGQQVEMLRFFVREEFTARGIVADIAIHEPDARDGEKQPHAHIMVSDRPLDASQPNGLAAKKDRTLADAKGIEILRERWATHCNKALERAHVPERVDHRSLADQRRAVLVVAADNTRPESERLKAEAQAQRLDRSPEPKIGPVALQMERQGRGADALALRDALEVREERGILARLVDTWQQVRNQVTQLAQSVRDELFIRQSVQNKIRQKNKDRTILADKVRKELSEKPDQFIKKLISDNRGMHQKLRQDVERFNKEPYHDYIDQSAWNAHLMHLHKKKNFEDANNKLEAWRKSHPFQAMLGEGFGEHKKLYEAAVEAEKKMFKAEQEERKTMKEREAAGEKARTDLSTAKSRDEALNALLAERQETEEAIAKALPGSPEAAALEDRRRAAERQQKAEQERKTLEATQKAQTRGKGHRRR
jgi:hypothetical protein